MVSKANSLAPPCFGPLQRADGAGDRRVHVRARARDHARGEGRGVELVLGVEDERGVHGAHPELRGLACRAAGAGSGRRWSRRRSRRRCAGPSARSGTSRAASSRSEAISRSAMSRASASLCVLAFGQHASPAPSTPVRSTSIGCVEAGMHSRTVLHVRGNAAQRLELALVGGELGGVGELPVHQQVGDLLEFGLRRRSRGCRSRGSAGRCRCARRCTGRCCRRARRRGRPISSASGVGGGSGFASLSMSYLAFAKSASSFCS